MMNRRHFFASSLGLCALARPAWAAPASRVCKVPSQAMGAIVAATGGTGLRIELDSAMDPRSISLDGKLASVTEALLIKGAGDAQKTFLDDARNAPRVGAAVRDLLAAAEPDRAAEFKDMHRAWARPWARRCIDWGKTCLLYTSDAADE